MMGIVLLKQHLAAHPYLDINSHLVTGLDFGNQTKLTWALVGEFDPQMKPRVSMLHGNKLLPDCMMQLNAD